MTKEVMPREVRLASARTEKTMAKKLEGKTVVITGGTEGIGLATARLFVKEGAHVFITGRRQKELDEAVKAIGTNISEVQGDVAQSAVWFAKIENASLFRLPIFGNARPRAINSSLGGVAWGIFVEPESDRRRGCPRARAMSRGKQFLILIQAANA